MTGSYLLGLDIGTSGAKAVIIDQDGSVFGSGSREYSIHTPQIGWAEQNPEDWFQAVCSCIKQVMTEAHILSRDVRCIGLAGQMHSLVCLDQEKKPIRAAIIWADQRSADQVARITQKIGKQALGQHTGNPLAAGFMAPSWAWLLDNEPETAAQTRHLLLPKDYVRMRLTGEIGSEPSDASSTLLFDPHTCEWSQEMLAVTGIKMEMMPPIQSSHTIGGHLILETAQSCGLLPGTPVVMGGSDVSLQALAQGIITPGTVSCTIGTGGQIFAPLQTPQHDPELRLHLFCHAIPFTWHQEAAILSAGLALRWLRDGLWPAESYQLLADQAAAVRAAAEELFFIPYLAGERTPHMDPSLTACFSGLTLRHQRAHFIRAVMEGVVFALRQGLDLMISLGTPVNQLIVSGGGTRHPLWLQLQANIFNRPVYVSAVQEATARGAAILAGIGSGLFANAQDAVSQAVREPILGAAPDPLQAPGYQDAYQAYTALASCYAKSKHPTGS